MTPAGVGRGCAEWVEERTRRSGRGAVVEGNGGELNSEKS